MSVNGNFSESHCKFTVESNDYTCIMTITSIQHGFIVTLKPIDVSVEKIIPRDDSMHVMKILEKLLYPVATE